jgi:type IV secretion system protein VirB10
MSQDQDNSATDGDGRKDAWRGQDKGFRGRENGQDRPTDDFDDNADLPALNRKRGGNKLITAAGYAFMGLLAVAAIVAVNRNPAPPAKKADDSKVSNRLPALIVPAPPEPPATLAPKVEEVQANNEEDIWKRKMSGNLVAQGGSSGGSGAGSRPAGPTGRQQIEQERMAQLTGGQGMGYGGGSSFIGPDGNPIDQSGQEGAVVTSSARPDSLGQRLKPTVTEAVSATVLPRRDYLLAKGAMLDCALETAIDSSVPGMTTCRLTRDVYSDNGRVLLLDRGTQLVGEYAGSLQRGQARMFLLWTRAKTPAGVVVNLNSPGTDSLGRSGIGGYVDNHFWERFGAAIMTSLLKDTVNIVANNRTKKPGDGGDQTNIYAGTMQSGEQIVGAMLREQAAIPSTLIVNQGQHIQVLMARDLDFSSVYGLRAVQ